METLSSTAFNGFKNYHFLKNSKYINNWIYVRPTKLSSYFALALQKEMFPRIQIKSGMTITIENLCEFIFIFEN
jgi:hypothetical protein